MRAFLQRLGSSLRDGTMFLGILAEAAFVLALTCAGLLVCFLISFA